MPDDVTLRSRRSRAHHVGDHSLCRPERCEHLRGGSQVLTFSPRVQSGVVGAYRSALEAAGRLDSPQGQLVIVLADRLMEPRQHTASALATLSRELRSAFDEAMQDAGQKADVIDGIFGTA